jgi:hypothetical protein
VRFRVIFFPPPPPPSFCFHRNSRRYQLVRQSNIILMPAHIAAAALLPWHSFSLIVEYDRTPFAPVDPHFLCLRRYCSFSLSLSIQVVLHTLPLNARLVRLFTPALSFDPMVPGPDAWIRSARFAAFPPILCAKRISIVR